MGYEIDFLAVGDGEKSGDAIAIRYGNLYGTRQEQTVVVIDGGDRTSGDSLVRHIGEHFGTNHVDIAILTHPDSDHASGLRSVLEKCTVDHLLMHRPWKHGTRIKKLLDDGRVTVSGIKAKLDDGLEAACQLEEIAQGRQVKLHEPFQGLTFQYGNPTPATFHFLGPSEDYYESLLPNFRSTPGPSQNILAALLGGVKEVAAEWVFETMNVETLSDVGDTSAENESSTVLYMSIEGHSFLFTGDTGCVGLARAILYANSQGISLKQLTVLQVPHHGSKRNIGPKILNCLGAERAIISAAAKSTKHPSKRVTNALIRRGMKPFSTKGKGWRYHKSAPERNGWVAATPISFAEAFNE
jgi:beta-lactamase superfamily II metal-dependent hydrolase